jgi:uncharacterized alkaline shock family protein YloU
MADNKQYITQAQENGSVMISEDVIVSIVELAVAEVEGIAGLSTKPGADIVDLIGKKNWGKGLKVSLNNDETISVDCNINVKYGHSVVDVAKAAQDAIISALDSMTGIKTSAVNVNVCGIVK